MVSRPAAGIFHHQPRNQAGEITHRVERLFQLNAADQAIRSGRTVADLAQEDGIVDVDPDGGAQLNSAAGDETKSASREIFQCGWHESVRVA